MLLTAHVLLTATVLAADDGDKAAAVDPVAALGLTGPAAPAAEAERRMPLALGDSGEVAAAVGLVGPFIAAFSALDRGDVGPKVAICAAAAAAVGDSSGVGGSCCGSSFHPIVFAVAASLPSIICSLSIFFCNRRAVRCSRKGSVCRTGCMAAAASMLTPLGPNPATAAGRGAPVPADAWLPPPPPGTIRTSSWICSADAVLRPKGDPKPSPEPLVLLSCKGGKFR